MTVRPKILVMAASCLAIPVPAYAMIELLPAFFAMTGLAVVLAAVPLALSIKGFLVRARFGQGVAVPWSRMCVVTAAEALIMTVSVLLSLANMDALALNKNGGGAALAAIPAVFFKPALFYSCLALFPNMWLLNRILDHPGLAEFARSRLAVAWILSLPLLCVVIAIIGGLVAWVS